MVKKKSSMQTGGSLCEYGSADEEECLFSITFHFVDNLLMVCPRNLKQCFEIFGNMLKIFISQFFGILPKIFKER